MPAPVRPAVLCDLWDGGDGNANAVHLALGASSVIALKFRVQVPYPRFGSFGRTITLKQASKEVELV